jgi:hypothetical protein
MNIDQAYLRIDLNALLLHTLENRKWRCPTRTTHPIHHYNESYTGSSDSRGQFYESNQYPPSQQRHPKKAITLSFIELDYRDPSF